MEQTIKMKGVYKITKAKLEISEHWRLHNEIENLMKNGGNYLPLVKQLNEMCRTEVMEFENIIPTVGRTLLANNLTATSPTNNPRINYTALGTGTTTPANGNTQLATETYRKQVSSETNADNVAYVTAFYTATEVTGTFYEHGLFCNGSASANSGVLFSRVLLNAPTGITKSATESLTIDYTITLS